MQRNTTRLLVSNRNSTAVDSSRHEPSSDMPRACTQQCMPGSCTGRGSSGRCGVSGGHSAADGSVTVSRSLHAWLLNVVTLHIAGAAKTRMSKLHAACVAMCTRRGRGAAREARHRQMAGGSVSSCASAAAKACGPGGLHVSGGAGEMLQAALWLLSSTGCCCCCWWCGDIAKAATSTADLQTRMAATINTRRVLYVCGCRQASSSWLLAKASIAALAALLRVQSAWGALYTRCAALQAATSAANARSVPLRPAALRAWYKRSICEFLNSSSALTALIGTGCSCLGSFVGIGDRLACGLRTTHSDSATAMVCEGIVAHEVVFRSTVDQLPSNDRACQHQLKTSPIAACVC